MVMFHHGEAEIEKDDIRYLSELVDPLKGVPFDLMLHTPGGLTDATNALLEYLENGGREFDVIVPFGAKSCGTLISLAAKAVHMGPASQLGPIDPQFKNIPAWALVKVGSQLQREVATAAIEHMKKMARKAAEGGLMEGRKDNDEIVATIENLMSADRYPSHGCAIDHAEAAGLNLNVKAYKADDPLWRMIWLLYCVYVADARRDGFGKFFESANVSLSFYEPEPQA